MASEILNIALVCFASVFLVFVTQGSTPPPRGHPTPIPSDDPHLQPSINFAAASVNQRCNCAYCQTVVGVANATEQIVEGIVYAFSIGLQDSDKCANAECMENVTSTDCPPSDNSKPYWCHATVLATPWSKPPYVMQDLTCQKPEH